MLVNDFFFPPWSCNVKRGLKLSIYSAVLSFIHPSVHFLCDRPSWYGPPVGGCRVTTRAKAETSRIQRPAHTRVRRRLLHARLTTLYVRGGIRLTLPLHVDGGRSFVLPLNLLKRLIKHL